MQKLFKLLIVPFLVLFLCAGSSIAAPIFFEDNADNWPDIFQLVLMGIQTERQILQAE